MISLSSLVMLVVSNGISFFLGAFLALNAGLVQCAATRISSTSNSQQQVVPGPLRNLQKDPSQEDAKCPPCPSLSDLPLLPETVQKFAAGMVHVNKEAFTNKFDLGVPLDMPKTGMEDVLVIYNRDKAMPKKLQEKTMNSIELVTADEAVENCDYMNVILTNHDQGRTQCLVIVPQVKHFVLYLKSHRFIHF